MGNSYSQTLEQQCLTDGCSLFLLCILRVGAELTIKEIIQEHRRRLRSTNEAERLAVGLLFPLLLRERLADLDDAELGELLVHEVWANLNALAPESTICLYVADRLRGIPRIDD